MSIIVKQEVAATRLRKSKEDYHTVFDPAEIGATQVAPATSRFRGVNPKTREFTGYSEDELLGMAFSLIIHPHEWEEDFERFRWIVCREISEYVIEERYPRKHDSVAG